MAFNLDVTGEHQESGVTPHYRVMENPGADPELIVGAFPFDRGRPLCSGQPNMGMHLTGIPLALHASK